MGNLSKAASGTQLTKAQSNDRIHALLDKGWDRISSVMPKHMSAERLYQLSVSAINKDPKLAEADPKTLLSCVMKCSALGVEPSAVDGLGRAYILPFRNKGRMEATFILGYRGMLDLIRRSGEVSVINVIAVYGVDNIPLTIDENGVPRMQPTQVNFDAKHEDKDLQYVFLHCAFKDGGQHNAYMTKAEIDAVRQRSKASTSGPWVTDYEAMAKKSIIRREAKYLPMSIEAQEAVASDETTPDYSNVFKPVFDESPTEQTDEIEDEPIEAQTAVCVNCGNAVVLADDATLDDLNGSMNCCGNPRYELA